jgi:hypothetical protein
MRKVREEDLILYRILSIDFLGEFDEHCLPNRHQTALKIETPIENRIFKLSDELFEQKSDSSLETINKQVKLLFV